MAELSLEVPSKVQGIHEYQRIWSAAVSEELLCSREFGNIHNQFVVAVKSLQLQYFVEVKCVKIFVLWIKQNLQKP